MRSDFSCLISTSLGNLDYTQKNGETKISAEVSDQNVRVAKCVHFALRNESQFGKQPFTKT